MREALCWSSCSSVHSHMWLQPRRVPPCHHVQFGASPPASPSQPHMYDPPHTTTAPPNASSSRLVLPIWTVCSVVDCLHPKGISMSSALRTSWICSVVEKELLDTYNSFEATYSPGGIIDDGKRRCSAISVTIKFRDKHKIVQILEVRFLSSIFSLGTEGFISFITQDKLLSARRYQMVLLICKQHFQKPVQILSDHSIVEMCPASEAAWWLSKVMI